MATQTIPSPDEILAGLPSPGGGAKLPSPDELLSKTPSDTRYETKLSPEEEPKFQQWKAKNAPKDSGDDYDLRGLFKSGQGSDARGHATDQFKKPNHPTFSTESQYSGKDGNIGGQWIKRDGKSFYLPSQTNMEHHSTDDLRQYFQEQEPDVELVEQAGPQGGSTPPPGAPVAGNPYAVQVGAPPILGAEPPQKAAAIITPALNRPAAGMPQLQPQEEKGTVRQAVEDLRGDIKKTLPFEAAKEFSDIVYGGLDLPAAKPGESKVDSAVNGLLKFATGLSTPETIALMFAGAGLVKFLPELATLPKVAEALKDSPKLAKAFDIATRSAVSGAFGAAGAKGTYESGKETVKQLQAGNIPGAIEAGVQTAASAFLAGFAAKHAIETGKQTAGTFPPERPAVPPGAFESEPGGLPGKVEPEVAAKTAEALEAAGRPLPAAEWRKIAENHPVSLGGGRTLYFEPPTGPNKRRFYRIEDSEGKVIRAGTADIIDSWLKQQGYTKPSAEAGGGVEVGGGTAETTPLVKKELVGQTTHVGGGPAESGIPAEDFEHEPGEPVPAEKPIGKGDSFNLPDGGSVKILSTTGDLAFVEKTGTDGKVKRTTMPVGDVRALQRPSNQGEKQEEKRPTPDEILEALGQAPAAEREEVVPEAPSRQPESGSVGDGSVSGPKNSGRRADVVKKPVVSLAEDAKILDPVVSAIPVDVVNMLGGKEAASQMLLHEPAVLIDHLAAPSNSDVPSNVESLLPVVASLRAKLSGPSATTRRPEYATALDAFDRHLGEARTRSLSPKPASSPVPLKNGQAAATPGAKLPSAGTDLAGNSGEGGAAEGAGSVDSHNDTLPHPLTGSTDEGVHKYSSTQVNLPEAIASRVRSFGKTIPSEHLQPEEGSSYGGSSSATGLENEIHATVKYGLHGEDHQEVADLLKDEPPIQATLGKASLFHTDEADVLKVDVESADLHRLNAKIAKLPHTDTHPVYKPHVTIAYLRRGEGKQYDGKDIPGVTGQKVTLGTVTFSSKSGQKTDISLTGKLPAEGGKLPVSQTTPVEKPSTQVAGVARYGHPEDLETPAYLQSGGTGSEARLPKGLAGAKPRYNHGSKAFSLDFESDIDRAAYIAAQANPSKHDAKYVDFASQNTGLSEEAVRAHGATVRQAIKVKAAAAKGGTQAKPEELQIPRQKIAKSDAAGSAAAPGDRTTPKPEVKASEAEKPKFDPKEKAHFDSLNDNEKAAYLVGKVVMGGWEKFGMTAGQAAAYVNKYIAVGRKRWGDARWLKVLEDNATPELRAEMKRQRDTGNWATLPRGIEAPTIDVVAQPATETKAPAAETKPSNPVEKVKVSETKPTETKPLTREEITAAAKAKQKELGAAALQRLKDRRAEGPVRKSTEAPKGEAEINPADLDDLGQMGAEWVLDGAITFGKWSTRATKEFSDAGLLKDFGRYMKQIHVRSQEIAEERMEEFSAPVATATAEKAEERSPAPAPRSAPAKAEEPRSPVADMAAVETTLAEYEAALRAARRDYQHILQLDELASTDRKLTAAEEDKFDNSEFRYNDKGHLAKEGERKSAIRRALILAGRAFDFAARQHDHAQWRASHANPLLVLQPDAKIPTAGEHVDEEVDADLKQSIEYVTDMMADARRQDERGDAVRTKYAADDVATAVKLLREDMDKLQHANPRVLIDARDAIQAAEALLARLAEPPVAEPEKEEQTEESEVSDGEQAEQPVRGPDSDALETELPGGSKAPRGGGRTPSARRGSRGTGRKGRGTSAGEGPELQPGAGPVDAGVGNTPDPELDRFPPRAPNPDSARHSHDYRIPDGREVGGNPAANARANIAAIRVLRDLQRDNRPAAVEEQDILGRYVGWGFVPQLFAGATPEFQKLQDDLRSLISEEEYNEASRSTTNAHYTSDAIVDAMWSAVQHLGATSGMSWLEPAVGVGTFFGRQPEALLDGARRIGLDKDALSAQIAAALYPDSGITHVALEDAELPDDYFDAAISNVPFGKFGVHDNTYRGHPYLTQPIHNYFFAKSLNLVRPGGIVAFITSRYTMDGYDQPHVQFRRWVSQRADFLGAVRLPSGAFKKNAGTDVITDLIFLRRHLPGEEPGGQSWLGTADLHLSGPHGSANIPINEYYARNPGNVLGKQSLQRGQFSDKDYDVDGKVTGDQIAAALKRALPADQFKPWKRTGAKATRVAIREINAPDVADKIGALFFDKDGNLFRKTSKGSAVPLDYGEMVKSRIKGQLNLKNVYNLLLEAERTDKAPETLAALRQTLNRSYDHYVKMHGPVSARNNMAVMKGDPDAPLLPTLERRYDTRTGTADKAPIFERRMLQATTRAEKADNAKDSLYIALNETGRLDWPRMTELTGKSEAELQQELKGLVYLDPATRVWQMAEEYLSGSVRTKLKLSERVAKIEPRFAENVEALKAAQPTPIQAAQISAMLGTTWVPMDVYSDFVTHVTGADQPVQVRYAGGEWQVDDRSYPATRFDTKEVKIRQLLNTSFNQRRIKVTYLDADRKERVDQAETLAARARQRELQAYFEKWLMLEDPARSAEMTTLYNDLNNDLRGRVYDGSHLTLPDMSHDPGVVRGGNLDAHQLAAVWRIISQPNVLLAHWVGTGKTFDMIAGGMELQRLGLIKRPMYVVPNATLPGWQLQFSQLYPQKRVIVFSDSDLEKKNRLKTIAMIATGEWDAVVMPSSSFKLIPVSDETFNAHYDKLAKQLVEQIKLAEEAGMDTRLIKRMETAKENLLTRLKDNRNAENQDNLVTWEQLGIDQLFVDEAHHYKKLGFATKQPQTMGIDQNGNQTTFDMLMKLRHTQKYGRGAVFASGTPVTNTMGELFNLMQYLIPEEMASRGISRFDEWAAGFGRTIDVFEPKIEGGGYRISQRFAEFVNLPELSVLFRTFADVVTNDMVKIPRPPLAGGSRIPVITQLSESQTKYLEEDLRPRAGSIRADPRRALPDNMLAIYTDAAKMALDIRMVMPWVADDPTNRINRAADVIYQDWKDGEKVRGAQAVFLDFGKPFGYQDKKHRGDFSPYDELIKQLVRRGIPKDEIAHVYVAGNNKLKRANLFRDVNEGKIRVVIGSTAKLGEGVNIQERLYSMHHLDLPHTPAELDQREGRGLRQGNINDDVRVYYYMTQGSLDESKFKNVVRKAKFIEAFLQNKSDVRKSEDVGGMIPSLEQFAAATSGDPRIMRKFEVDSEIDRLGSIRWAWRDQQWQGQRLISQEGPLRISNDRAAIRRSQDLLEKRETRPENWTVDGKKVDLSEDGSTWKLSEDLHKAIHRKKDGKQTGREEIGSVHGISLSTDGDWLYFNDSPSAYTYVADAAPRGVITKVRNYLSGIEGRIAQSEQDIATTEREIEAAKAIMEDSWPYQGEYDKLVEEQEELQRALLGNGDDAAVAGADGEEIADASVDAEDGESDEEDDEGPVRTSREQRTVSAPATLPARTENGAPHAAEYRHGVVWIDGKAMALIGRIMSTTDASGFYSPPMASRDLLQKLEGDQNWKRVADAVRTAIADSRHHGSIIIVSNERGRGLANLKATVRHERFHQAMGNLMGAARGHIFLRHPLAQLAADNLSERYDRGDDATMWAEIGAHLAAGPLHWERMGLDRGQAKELFREYLKLLDDATIKKIEHASPLLNEVLYGERAIGQVRRAGVAPDEETEVSPGQGNVRPGVRPSIPASEARPGETVSAKLKRLASDETAAINTAPLTAATKEAAATAAKAMLAGKRSLQVLLTPGALAPETGLTVRARAAELARASGIAERALQSAYDLFETLPVAQRWDFYDRVETGRPQWDPRLSIIAKIMRLLLDHARDEVRALGTGKLEGFIVNYLPHAYKDPQRAAQMFGEYYAKAPYEGKKAFLKRRKYETLRDAMDNGLEPISENPVDLILLKIREMGKYVMAHRVLADEKRAWRLVYVPVHKRAPVGWGKIDDKIGTVFGPPEITVQQPAVLQSSVGQVGGMLPGNQPPGAQYTGTTPGLRIMGHYYGPEDSVRLINNYLSPGFRGNPLFRGYLTVSNAMLQFQLGFSAFHLGFTTIDATTSKLALAIYQASHGNFAKAGKSALLTLPELLGIPIAIAAKAAEKVGVQGAWDEAAPFSGIIRGDQLLKGLYGPGSQGADIARIVDAIVSGGGRGDMDKFYKTNLTKNMMQAFHKAMLPAQNVFNRAGNVAKGIWLSPFAAAEQAARPILEYVVPRQKMAVFADLARYELERFEEGQISDQQLRTALAAASDAVDDRMGQLIYDNLHWNKAIKDLSMAAVRSVGWNLGSIRAFLGGLSDVFKMRPPHKEGGKWVFDPKMSIRVSYLIALPIIAGLIGSTIHYLATGESPAELKDYYFPRSGRRGTPGWNKRWSLPTYIKDAMHVWNKGVVETAKGKINPLLSLIWEMLANKDYFDRPIRMENDGLVKTLKEETLFALESFEPMSLKPPPGKPKVESTRDKILRYGGLAEAPGYIQGTAKPRQVKQHEARF